MELPSNPFEITKAVDFTDEEIAATWVDLPGGGFTGLADPKSPMPTFLVGGKGGGRTHLLRYFSYSLQRLRHADDILAGIREEEYLGIYFRCGGLNSSRFEGKRLDEETWAAMFSYYTEVWLARLTLDLILDLSREVPQKFPEDEKREFVSAVTSLFDIEIGLPKEEQAIEGLIREFKTLQRELDVAINNAALKHRLDVRIGATPGRLVFGIPQAASNHLTALSGLVFAYLVDEFENLTIPQQKYVNTLLREKELPATFLVGSRLFGIKTRMTLSAGEENRQGSEFQQVVLEKAYRVQSHKYPEFCRGIVSRRLTEHGIDLPRQGSLDDFFAKPPGSSLEDLAVVHTQKRMGDSGENPWIVRLRRQLIRTEVKRFNECIKHLVVPDSPLHEKFAVFLFYRAWAEGEDLQDASVRIKGEVGELRVSKETNKKIATTYKHYHRDLYAQLLSDLRLPQEYYGLPDFVRMSGYLPRNLLVVLKEVTRWSSFRGEQPFRSKERISLDAQREGVRDASAWFLSDSKGLGRIAEETQLAIRRLASLFREMRFSDKPVEVSCSSFSTDRQGLTKQALACLDEAVSHSLIVEVSTGRKERNTHLLQHKYQLNPMLSPLFDLPLALRGSASFNKNELNAIFDQSQSDAFDSTVRRIIGRMNAPFSIPTIQDSFQLG